MATDGASFATRNGATCAATRTLSLRHGRVRPHRSGRRRGHRAEPLRAAGPARAALGDRRVRACAAARRRDRPVGDVPADHRVHRDRAAAHRAGRLGAAVGRASSSWPIAGVAAIVPAVGHRLDRPLAGLSRLGPKRMGDGFGSGLLVGAALGFVYAPCAGPVLAAVVAASAATGRTVAIAAGYTRGHRGGALRDRPRRPARAGAAAPGGRAAGAAGARARCCSRPPSCSRSAWTRASRPRSPATRPTSP